MSIPLDIVIWFLAGSSLVFLVFLLLGSRSRKEETAALAGAGGTDDAMPFGPREMNRVDEIVSQRLKSEERKSELRERMVQAGLYQRNAAAIFLGVRVVLLILMVGIGVIVSQLGLMPLTLSLLIALLFGVAATIAPSFWLDIVKRSRQVNIRRALPDALDVIAVCLQGGLSLPASFVRVARELGTAHPLLALELAIVERESQMGYSTGQALKRFAERFDLEELRSLASIVAQAEKFGSSLTRAMEVYAETLRHKRHQRAEEMAHKAAIKILFPTLFCIFPGIFVVILGPAAIRIYETFVVNGVLSGIVR